MKQFTKKTLLKETAISIVFLITLAGASWYLDTISDNYEKDVSALTSNIAAINGEIKNLQNRHVKVEKYASTYQEAIQKKNKNLLSISHDAVRSKFDEFKNNFHLANLHVSMSPIQTITDVTYKRDSVFMESSIVNVTFDATSDENVYQLLKALANEMPGAVKVNHLIISRSAALSDETLRTISVQGSALLIKADLNFTWYGLQSISPKPKVPPKGL